MSFARDHAAAVCLLIPARMWYRTCTPEARADGMPRGTSGAAMSQKNGDKSRYQINRKRAVLRRAKIRAMLAAGQFGQERPAHSKLRPAKA